MLIIISPAKSQDFTKTIKHDVTSTHEFRDETWELVKQYRKLSQSQMQDLMKISNKLAKLNYQRYQDFSATYANAKPALHSFTGDVYDGIDVENYNIDDIHYAQEHLRIISGLYGLLRPMDLIQPYRLEMKTKLINSDNLYQFWDNKITNSLYNTLEQHKNKILINLASSEYSSAIKFAKLKKIVTPVFKENKTGTYKIIGLFAKRARGMMANFIIKNHIDNVESLKTFNEDGYKFAPSMSNENEFIFIR